MGARPRGCGGWVLVPTLPGQADQWEGKQARKSRQALCVRVVSDRRSTGQPAVTLGKDLKGDVGEISPTTCRAVTAEIQKLLQGP